MIKNLFRPSKEGVIQAIFKTSALNFLARVFGYLKQVSIAVLIGFSFDTDAFFLALSILGIFFTFTQVFDSLGIPNLVKARQKSLTTFHKLTASLLTFTTILAFGITIGVFILSPWLVNIALGFNEIERELLKEYLWLLLPYLFFSFFFHHFGAIHRSLKHFSVYFFGEFLFSLSSFLFISLGLLFTKNPKILPISLSLAQLISTVYIFLISKPYWKINFKIDKNLKKFLKLFSQLVVVQSIFHLFMLTDKAFATYLPHKSISALSYGLIIATIPRGLFKVEYILITSLSEINADWDKAKLYLLKVFLFSLPFVAFIFIFAPYLVKLLFGYGAFSLTDAELTTTAARLYVLGLPFMFLWAIFYRIFLIKEKLLWLIPVGIAVVFFNLFLNYFFIFKLNLGLSGICLATDIAYFNLVTLSYLIFHQLNRK